MLLNKHHGFFSGFVHIAQIFVFSILITSIYFTAQSAQAAPVANIAVHGWAWSSTIGWISMSCENQSTCLSNGGYDYGVSVDGSNNLTGYAWSENIGWIKFDGLSSFPSAVGNAGGQARAVADGSGWVLEGFARACSATDDGNSASAVGDCSSMVTDPQSGGWSGWISLRGSNHSIRLDSSNHVATDSYAWGGGGSDLDSAVIGWVDFDAVSFSGAVPPSCSFTGATPSAVPTAGQNVIFTWTTSNTVSAELTGPGIPDTDVTGLNTYPAIVTPGNYRIEVTSADGDTSSCQQSITDNSVAVIPGTFVVTPTEINWGDDVTLAWNPGGTPSVPNCVAYDDEGSSPVAVDEFGGAILQKPSYDSSDGLTIYTLLCQPGGTFDIPTTDDVKIKPDIEIVNFTTEPQSSWTSNPNGTFEVEFEARAMQIPDGSTVQLLIEHKLPAVVRTGFVTGNPALTIGNINGAANNYDDIQVARLEATMDIGLGYSSHLELDLPLVDSVVDEDNTLTLSVDEDVVGNTSLPTPFDVLPADPVITATAKNLVRRGAVETFELTIDTPYELECTVSGSIDNIDGLPGNAITTLEFPTLSETFTVTTEALMNTTVFSISCEENNYTNTVFTPIEIRIEVIPDYVEV